MGRFADAELGLVLGGHWPAPTIAPLPQKTTMVTAEETLLVALSLVQGWFNQQRNATRAHRIHEQSNVHSTAVRPLG